MTNIRITYRRRTSYNTASNAIRKVKTPGGRIVAQYVAKKAGVPKCGDTGVALQGLTPFRGKEGRLVPRRKRTVTRAYGGVLCGQAVRLRIVRAFMTEERKLVKTFQRARESQLKSKAKEAKKAAKKGDGKKKGKKN